MHDTAKLNELAKCEIDNLQAEGITLTPAEIVELNALGWAVHNPQTRTTLSRGRPVMVGGVYLWPLTMRAVDWMERNEFSLTSISPALGYAMAYGRGDGPELDQYGDQADKAVKTWFRKLNCTMLEFVEAIKQIDEQDAKPELPQDLDGKPMSLGDFSAFLSATCGADADFWERRCSISYCLSVLAMVVMQNHADKRPCAQDPRIIAERALGFAVDKIKMRHNAEAIING